MRRGLKHHPNQKPSNHGAKRQRCRPDEKGIETYSPLLRSHSPWHWQRCRPDEKGIETLYTSAAELNSTGSAAAPMRRGLKLDRGIVAENDPFFGSAAAPMRRGLKRMRRPTAVMNLASAALPPR